MNDPRWKELKHRGWTGGARSQLDAEAPYAPDELANLIKKPSDIARFQNLWPYLCSKGTAWVAPYAAVPYVVELARRISPDQRMEHLYFVGLVEICSCPESGAAFENKPYLTQSYRQARVEGLPLVAETLVNGHNLTETRYLLAAAAALKGHTNLGRVLNQ